MNATRLTLMFCLALALFGAGTTGYLTTEHAGGGAPVCGIGHGCEVVARSSYARVGGIPTAAFGTLLYLLLVVVYSARLLNPPDEVDRIFQVVSAGGVTVGAAMSGWLTYIEIFVLHAVCAWCVASASAMALLLVLHGISLLPRRSSTWKRIPQSDQDIKQFRSN